MERSRKQRCIICSLSSLSFLGSTFVHMNAIPTDSEVILDMITGFATETPIRPLLHFSTTPWGIHTGVCWAVFYVFKLIISATKLRKN